MRGIESERTALYVVYVHTTTTRGADAARHGRRGWAFAHAYSATEEHLLGTAELSRLFRRVPSRSHLATVDAVAQSTRTAAASKQATSLRPAHAHSAPGGEALRASKLRARLICSLSQY